MSQPIAEEYDDNQKDDFIIPRCFMSPSARSTLDTASLISIDNSDEMKCPFSHLIILENSSSSHQYEILCSVKRNQRRISLP
mmetsp:Transcript_16405/g.30637  ORF Transcript_16405/g.30637 Transcript_16405/m.30637 type:complete len:82 (+) Transcript_16405:215-460(+)